MKFQCVNELDQLSFDDAGIGSFRVEEKKIEFTFQGALVKAKNSQNARYQDMYCGEIVLQLENAEIARLVKEGMKYYDADGNLQSEIPDEDVPAPAQDAVLKRLAKGTVFTVVHDDVKEGYAAEFGIDVPKEDDAEEIDTFWLCVTYEKSVAGWDRYCSPAEEN